MIIVIMNNTNNHDSHDNDNDNNDSNMHIAIPPAGELPGLRRQGRVAYSGQRPWIPSGTLLEAVSYYHV